MPPVGFQVGHSRPVLNDGDVALLIHTLDRHDRRRPGAAAVDELLHRIREAAAIQQPPFQHVQVDARVAEVLVGAINRLDREIGASDDLLRLRIATRALLGQH